MKLQHFIAFNLEDFHKQSNAGATVRVKFIGAKSLDDAKRLVGTYYDESWSVVSKKVFDEGIVLRQEA